MNRQDDQMSASSDSGSDIDVRQDSEGWEDLEPDTETIAVKDFFGDTTFPSARAMLDHAQATHGFDFLQVHKRLGLDFLETVKFINYIRREAVNGVAAVSVDSKEAFASDDFLRPTLEDDALLFSIGDVIEDAEAEADAQAGAGPLDDVDALKQRLAELESQFEQYRTDVAKTLDERWGADQTSETLGESAYATRHAAESEKKYDQGYFDAYSYNDIHQVMLQDNIRTDAYRDFIYGNKHLFAGKTVLDVGCGTGILSMFCAKAGAARVIAVDNSNIIDKTRTIIQANKLDGIITCVKGKIEEVTLPDGITQVDVIVSEWMGYCLLFEAMLDSVLHARDRYLAPTGLMVPSHCTLHVGALADPEYVEDNFSFWQDVYGFEMTAMMEKIYDDVLVRAPEGKAIAGRARERRPFRVLDLHTVTTRDLEFGADVEVRFERGVDRLDGFCFWFDTIFMTERGHEVPTAMLQGSDEAKGKGEGNVFFSTGPFSKQTHWQCALCMIDNRGAKGKAIEQGTELTGKIVFKKNKAERRALNIEVVWGVAGGSEGGQQKWFLR